MYRRTAGNRELVAHNGQRELVAHNGRRVGRTSIHGVRWGLGGTRMVAEDDPLVTGGDNESWHALPGLES